MAATEPLADAEPAGSDELWKAWETLDVPPGFRAEIIRGDIVLSPSPTNRHSLICTEIMRQLWPLADERDWRLANELGVRIESTGEVLIPDLMALPVAVLTDGEETSAIDSPELLLAVEVTSDSSVSRDRETKLWSYAAGLVPVYMMVDRHDRNGTVRVFSEPSGEGRYQHYDLFDFGKPVRLPEPFNVEIDTSLFAPRTRRA
ncbi:Uma2 family endonuclease [Glycomyces artemisiae]|uniref:Uma2 family endonuclease n=1 Tax=Glycomyces artemisiae TaxID=1076443 RepID=A0A2T0UJ51_9ACTN|nr:Uma2 family endonuclease [Glycomyces artemisiae]PRY57896.1 Uma2 family endonuclease [Glycomyces artemisiae]